MNQIKFVLILSFLIFVSGVYAADEPGIVNKGSVQFDQPILMSDRISLATDIYIPPGEGPFACILIRTPYDKKGSKKDCEWFQKNGFAVVSQDCRGKYHSQGKFYPWRNERADGIETVKWIRAQKWSNGKISSWGGSYVGYTQWAVSDQVDVITPLATGSDVYDLIYPSGIFSLGLAFSWGFIVDSQQTNSINPEQSRASYSILPLSSAAEATYGKSSVFMDDWLRHTERDKYWQSQCNRGIAKGDVLSIAGWYDIFLLDQLADFEDLPVNRADHRLIVTPMCHGTQALENTYGGAEKTGDAISLARRFLIRHLKDEQMQVFKPPFKDTKYNLFIMERNEFYGADNWPPKATSFIDYYIGADKTLSPVVPQDSDVLTYNYDPADPYPNLGGTAIGENVGPALQNSNVGRKDQVVFESSELNSSLVLLGPISATLYVSSDAINTDFYVCLQDVFEDGRIVNIQEGGASVSLTKSDVKKLNVDIWAAGYQLNPGHKLRTVICSSWFPRFNRNLNSDEPIYSAVESKIARQKIHFGGEYPSHITLPVLKVRKNKVESKKK